MLNSVHERLEISRKMLVTLSKELDLATTTAEKQVIMEEMSGVLARINRMNMGLKRQGLIESIVNNMKKLFKNK